MRVLITGARGQVGHELLRLAPATFEAIGMSSAELDITHPGAVASAVKDLRPLMIINAAAYTAVDLAESEPERAYAVNRDGVVNLATHAQLLGIPLFHMSTDYVFSGEGSEPYVESDATGPTGVYGASKLAGERALADQCQRHIILRTSWVFGAHGNNFVKTMLRLGRQREELSVVDDQYGCPTSAASLARALWMLASRYQSRQSLQWGTYHCSGTPPCTWYEFALEIFRQAVELGLLKAAPRVHPISSAMYPTPARRPAWSVMSTELLEQTHAIRPANWHNELRQVLLELGRTDTEV